MTASKTIYGRGWEPIDLKGPLGEIEVLIEFVEEILRDRGSGETELLVARENLEELSLDYSEFMNAVAEYIGDEYALYTRNDEYARAEKKWEEYKMNDWIMS